MSDVRIEEFELLDGDERVIIKLSNGKWIEKKVFNVGSEGILCNDLETYIEFADFEEAS